MFLEHQIVYTKILSSNKRIRNIINNRVIIIDHHIRVISEGSCDTEDWSNDINSALMTGTHYILLNIHTENS